MGIDIERIKKEGILVSGIEEKTVWNVYCYQGKFIKVLNVKKDQIKEKYYRLLLELQKKQKHPNISSVEEICGEKKDFNAYQCSSMKGKSLFEYNASKQLAIVPSVIKSFMPILNYAQKEKIVFLDLFNTGNVLYDESNSQINIIDVDSFQVGQSQAVYISEDLNHSHCAMLFSLLDKYFHNNLLTSELNVFMVYELFFRMVLKRSLLKISFQPFLDKEIPFEMQKGLKLGFENHFLKFLEYTGLSKKDDLFERLLDLFRDTPNSICVDDFYCLFEKYDAIDKNNQTKLIRK